MSQQFNNPNQPTPYAQPNYYQPQQPPQKHGQGKWIVIACIIAFMIVTGGILSEGKSGGSISLPGSGTWTTTHTFTGSGNQQTAIFNVADDWKILYACAYQQINGTSTTVDGALGVIVHNADSSVLNVPVNARCTSAQTSGETEEHVGGSIYLEIDAATDGWTIQVQELE